MSFRLSMTLAALACAASPALAQTPPAGPPRTASVNTGPRVDVSAMPRPIDLHDSVWIEQLTMLEVRDEWTQPSQYAAAYGGTLPFDWVWFTPRVSDNDPCASFRRTPTAPAR